MNPLNPQASALQVKSNLVIYPRFGVSGVNVFTLTGYSPLKSIYPSNSGTVFTIIPSATFVNTTGSPGLTSINVSYFGSLTSTATVFDSLTSFTVANALPGFYTQANRVFPGFVLPFTMTSTISTSVNPFFNGDEDNKNIVLVDPPEVLIDVRSLSTSHQQNGVVIVSQNANFFIDIRKQLPVVCFLRYGLNPPVWITESQSIPINVVSTATAVLCAFPLLRPLPDTNYNTHVNYITGNQRTLDTGTLPIVVQQPIILSNVSYILPPESNVQLSYSIFPVQYNNKHTELSLSTNVSQVTSLNFINQFDQPISPVISLSANIQDLTTLFKNSLTQKNFELTIEFNNITQTVVFNVDSPSQTPCVLNTTAPLISSNIKVTCRPIDSTNTLTRLIPYTPIKSQFIIPGIYFNKFTPSWYASITNPYPFEVIIWNDSDNPINQIQTYVEGSNSSPYSPDFTRYSKLLPQWYFQTVDREITDVFSCDLNKIYNSYDSSFIGTSGSIEFLFTEDSPTGPQGELLVISPIVSGLIAPNDTQFNIVNQPSFANPRTRTTLKYHVSHIHPNILNITKDGIRNLKNYYWYTGSVPNVITFNSSQVLDGSVKPVNLQITPVGNGLNYTVGISSADFFDITSPTSSTESNKFKISYYNKNFTDFLNNNNKASFVRTSITPLITSNNLIQLICTSTVSPTGQYSHTPFAWICNNKDKCLAKIYVEDSQNNCFQNTISQTINNIPITGAYNQQNVNLSLSSYFGIDGKYNAWFINENRLLTISTDLQTQRQITISNDSIGSICFNSLQNALISLKNNEKTLIIPTEEYIEYIPQPLNPNNKLSPIWTETDINDNIWIGYEGTIEIQNIIHPVFTINKYTSTKELSHVITLPLNHKPIKLFIDEQNPIIARVLIHYLNSKNEPVAGLFEINQSNNITPLMTDFKRPTYYNIDNNRNIWFVIGEYVAFSYNVDDKESSLYDLIEIINDVSTSTAPYKEAIIYPEFSLVYEQLFNDINLTNKFNIPHAWVNLPSNNTGLVPSYNNETAGNFFLTTTQGGGTIVNSINLTSTLTISASNITINWWEKATTQNRANTARFSLGRSSLENGIIARQTDLYWRIATVASDTTLSPAGFNYVDCTINNFFLYDNNWHFYSVVKNGSNVSGYRDGVLINQVPLIPFRPQTTNSILTGLDFNLQLRNINTVPSVLTNDRFVGAIDDIRIWNIPLTQFQITNLLNNNYTLTNLNAFNNTIQSTNKITGIGGHSNGSVWFILNKHNKILITDYNKADKSLVLNKYFQITEPSTSNINTIDVFANGDWTGLHHQLKFCPNKLKSPTLIFGKSTPFLLKTSPPDIRIQNDNYNLSESLSKMLPEVIDKFNLPILHNQFLPGALGTNESDYQSISRQFFEKIANFTSNHMDVDFCNINQLYNIAEMLNIPLDDYNLSFPPDIENLINKTSIQFKRLFGEKDVFDRRFTNQQIFSNDNDVTLSNKLNFDPEHLAPDTNLSPGDKIICYDITNNSYILLYIHTGTLLKNITGYGLRSLVYNFDINQFDQYIFYRARQSNSDNFINSHINWDYTTNTISPSTSIQQWYEDEGIVDQMFNYNLTRGLGFLNEKLGK